MKSFRNITLPDVVMYPDPIAAVLLFFTGVYHHISYSTNTLPQFLQDVYIGITINFDIFESLVERSHGTSGKSKHCSPGNCWFDGTNTSSLSKLGISL